MELFLLVMGKNDSLIPYKEQFIKAKDTVRSHCSATFLRNKMRRGKSIRYLGLDEGYEYEKIKGLYTIVQT